MDSYIIINSDFVIELIPACIAGSAYLLLLILNLSTPMTYKKRIYSLFFSFASLLILNILRISFLLLLYYKNFSFFDITHKIFWFGLSSVFVAGIWFFAVKLFSIGEIPVYSDIKNLITEIKRL